MKDALTLSEIADALDTLADVMVSDRMDQLAGHAGGCTAANRLAGDALDGTIKSG